MCHERETFRKRKLCGFVNQRLKKVMLNQTSHQINLTMWTSTTQLHREAMKYDGGLQRRIYWDLNKAIITMVTMVTLIVGVAGNVMVLLTLCIRRLMHNPMSYYLANLAVVHTLLSLVVCPFLTFHVLRDARYQREVCASFYILLYSLALLVALAVLTIGVDRVWKERWSWHYLSRHSGRLALAVMAGCWAAALVLVTTLELTSSAQHPLRSHMCSGSGGRAAQRLQTTAPGDVAMEVIFYTCYCAAFICLVIVQIMYGRKIRKTGHLPGALTGDALVQVPEKDAEEVRETGGRLAPRLNKRVYEDGDQEGRSVRTLLLLVIMHTICWLPFYVVYSLNAHVSTAFVPYHIVEMVHYLALLSSPLNPLLYYFSSVEFNMVMRQLLGAMCCRAVSLSSGSTVSLEWEPLHCISDDQLEAFNADADRLSVGPTPSPSRKLKAQMSDAAIGAGSSIADRSRVRRELHEVQGTDGPSAELYGLRNLPPLSPERPQSRTSDSSLMKAMAASFQNQSPRQITVGKGSPPAPTVRLTPTTLDVVLRDGRRHQHDPPSVSPADSQRSGRSHRVMAGLKNLFRRGQPGSRGRSESSQPGSRIGPDSSQPGSAAVTPDQPEKRSFAARVAALWHRRRIGPRQEGQEGQRTASEESLVRRLVLAGLPSGVVTAARGRRRRLSGVWRSPGGRLHRLDPAAEEYPALLERMAATDSGYRTPTGQRIHHVCAVHHVHGQCHHHDMRLGVPPPPARPRQQTSVGNWTAPGLVQERPVRQPPPPAPPRPDGTSSSDSEGADAVRRIINL